MRHTLRHLTIATFSIGLLFGTPSVPQAQSLFSTAIRVNDGAITGYELSQRERLLSVLNAPGNKKRLAKTQLIEDRLKLGAAKQLGIRISEDEIDQGVDEFAARTQKTGPALVADLARRGVSESTIRAFIEAGLAWRQVVRAKFGSQSQVSEDQIERTTNTGQGGTSIQVLLSELIMPLQPQFEEEVRAIAKEVSGYTSTARFSAAAREYSAVPTRDQGGRLEWQRLDKLPPVLQPLIFDLKPGEVTEPLELPNAIALFQLRAMTETPYSRPTPVSVDYATYSVPNGDEALSNLSASLVHCDDLYGFAKDNATHSLRRLSGDPKTLPSSLRTTLSRLDINEFELSQAEGFATITMLCGRAFAPEESLDLDAIRNGLRNKKLETYANGYLENLRQDARIVEK